MGNIDLCDRRGPGEDGRWGGAYPRGKLVGALVVALGALAACASTPPHYPSQTAQTYVGKTLFKLEMRWSVPSNIDPLNGGHTASWMFNQYNYAGCTVTVHTDSQDIIRSVSWTQGCGPKTPQPAAASGKHPAS